MSTPAFPPSFAQRLFSLDVFRGLTLAVMILVNNLDGETTWRFTQHADWNGFTIADLVFPGFLFAAGASLVFALESRLTKGFSRLLLAGQMARRAALLFAIGLLLNLLAFDPLHHLRVYGVLQRIALCYLAAGLIYLLLRRAKWILLVTALLLVGYWGLLRWVPIPGAGMPGRDLPLLDERQNLASWLDRQLLSGHLFAPDDPPVYNLSDPEGLLSTLPAVASTLIGALVAIGLRHPRYKPGQKPLGMLAAAALCLLLGYAWARSFPLNKNLWTSSYVLVAAGWSLAAMALLHWLLEERRWRGFWSKPWVIFGTNSISCYLFSELLVRLLRVVPAGIRNNRIPVGDMLFELIQRVFPSQEWAVLGYSLLIVACSFLLSWFLWNRRIFVKL